MPSTSYVFDDLALFNETTSSDGQDWHAGYVSGEATIEFDYDNSWSLYAIQIDIYGHGGKWRRVYLTEADPVYGIIKTYLLAHCRECIELRVADALTEINSPFNRREDAAEYRRRA